MKLLWVQKQSIESVTRLVIDRALEAAGGLIGNKGTTCIPVDRGGVVSPKVNIDFDPIPAPDASLDFNDIMRERAEEIILKSDELSGGFIDLYWSGGIDSTAALIALIQSLGIDEYDRLTIYATEDSIKEYPLFWQTNKGLFRFILVHSPFLRQPQTHFCSNCSPVKVSGELGDQLYGSMMFFEPGSAVAVTALLEGPHGEAIKAQAAPAPYPLKDWRDWLWWWNFSLKWVDVAHRICSQGRANANHHFAFYRSEKFQAWAQANPELRADRPYKRPSREFIETYTSDPVYTKEKEKVRSLMMGEGLVGPRAGAIVEDGSFLAHDDARLGDYVIP